MYLGLIFTDANIFILGNTGQFVLHVTASRCHCGNPRCPWIQLSDCSADCLQDHIANTDFSHPVAGVVFWPALAYSPAKYLHCRLFFPKRIVTISLHVSEMNLILLSAFKWNYLRLIYVFLICVSVVFAVSSVKVIYFLQRMPSVASLKKTLNRKCSNNVSFRSSIYLPSLLSWYGSSLSLIMILGLASNPCDNKSTYSDFIGLMSKYQGKTSIQNSYIALAFKYCVSLLTAGMAVLRNTSLLDWALDLT